MPADATPWWDSIWLTLCVAWLVFGLIAAHHAIVNKRESSSASLWALVSFVIPIAGPWFYWAFGINRIARRAQERLGGRRRPFERAAHDAGPENGEIDGRVEGLTALRAVGDRVTTLALSGGNLVEPLFHGERAYPAMLEAIRASKKSVTLASYIFDWDEVGREFAHTLSDAADRGVAVHVLADGVGAVLSFSAMGRYLIRSGAEVAAFFPLRFPLGRLRLNLRNHRKILVVDGLVGFTGGMNISEAHLMEHDGPGRSEDVHFRIQGPVVARLQHTFAEDWLLATGRGLRGEAYFPALSRVGDSVCRGVTSGPDEDFEKIHLMIQAAIQAARESVYIMTPYFVPSAALIASLVGAALRGVRVVLILPSVVDHRYMRWVADAYLWQLLSQGAEVYRHPAPFVHIKLMVVDGAWTFFGSANMDMRSFRLNFELNVEAYDSALAGSLAAFVEERVGRSERVTLEMVDGRSGLVRFRDGFLKLFSAYL